MGVGQRWLQLKQGLRRLSAPRKSTSLSASSSQGMLNYLPESVRPSR